MKTTNLLNAIITPRKFAAIGLAILAFALSNCAYRMGDRFAYGHARPLEPSNPGVKITRQGRDVPYDPDLRLEQGDLISTGPDTGVVVWGKGSSGGVFLYPQTAVEIGSIRLRFGKLLAKVRGAFQVTSHSVTASVEGTIFLIEAKRASVVDLMVIEGAVRFASETQAVLVTEGNRSIARGTQIGQPVPVDPKTLQAWKAQALTVFEAAAPVAGLPPVTQDIFLIPRRPRPDPRPDPERESPGRTPPRQPPIIKVDPNPRMQRLPDLIKRPTPQQTIPKIN